MINFTAIWHRIFPSKTRQEWSIGIYQGSSPFNIAPINNNPVFTKEDVTDRDAAYVADPFMIKVANLWYMFFEVRNKNSYLTELAYATSKDGFDWKYKKVIPMKSFQSFPYIFEWEGEYYMIPECNKSKSIRIYKAKNFPEEWVLESILIKGIGYVDPSIFRYNTKWWIITSTTSNKEMYIFYSNNLTEGWKEHSLNPIIKDDKTKARSAGRIIVHKGEIYRFAQDCKKYYGNKVRAFKITKLTETEYEEEPAGEVLVGGEFEWNSKGMHTFDAHQIEDGKWLVAVDGYKEVTTKQ